MDWITERIAIGSIDDAMDTDALRLSGITGVLCLNGFPHIPKHRGFEWLNVTLVDGPGNSLTEVRAAVDGLATLNHSHTVLVHCAEGLSRSAFIVACYLAEEWAVSFDEAAAHVKAHRERSHIDAGLLALLESGWPIGGDLKIVADGLPGDAH